MSLFNILVDIGASTANIEAALTRVEGKIKDFGSSIQSIGEVIGAGFLLEFTKSMVDLGAAVERNSRITGTSIEAFQELSYAAKQSGVGTDELSAALIKMNKALSDAATGARAPNDALRALGLSLDELKKLSPDQQLEIIADRISKLPTPADKARAEIVLFGRAGGQLGALMEQGAAGIIKLRTEAETLGGVMSEDTVKNLEEAHKSIDRMEASFSTLAATLVGKVAPSLTSVLDTLTHLASGTRDTQAAVKQYSDLLENALSEHAQFGQLGTTEEIQRFRRARDEALAQQGFQGLLVNPQSLTSSGTQLSSLLGGSAPGFEATQIPDLTVHITDVMKKYSVGMEALLEQFNQDTIRVQDRAETTYDLTMLKLKELLLAGIIDPDEFKRRAEAALSKYNEVFDQLQPIIITAKKVIDTTSVEAALDRFVDDVKGAMYRATQESGNFGRNLLIDILKALEDRAIKYAIDDIGAYLSSVLRKSAQSLQASGSGGGFWATLIQAAIGIFGGSVGGGLDTGAIEAEGAAANSEIPTAAAIPGYAEGGFTASNKLLLVGERGPELFRPSTSGTIIPNDQLGGAGPTFNFSYVINAPNGDQQLRQALPGLLASTAARSKRDMLEAFRRNNLPAPRSA